MRNVTESLHPGQKTGKAGRVCIIEAIDWQDTSHAEVKVGFGGYGMVYSVVKENGKWVVSKHEMTWIA